MTFRIRSMVRCRAIRAVVGAATMSGAICSSMLHAEQFEAMASIPSVLAATTDEQTGVVIPGQVFRETAATGPTVGGDWSQPTGNNGVANRAVSDASQVMIGDGFASCSDAFGDGSACGATAGGCGEAGCCDAPGLLQYLRKCHDKGNACWVGRADALILWRDAPPGRPLVDTGLAGLPVLNAHGMDSEAAAGPRLSLFRFNQCNGTGWETTYLRAANWRSQRPLSLQNDSYALSPPGIYGNDNTQNFDVGNANLGSRLQSLEFNRHWSKGEHLRFLAGFRWVEWQEDFSLATTFNGPPTFQDYYNTSSINSLYGGQIGLDAWLLSLPWMRIDSVIKAGAYYNNGVQSSLYQSNATGGLVSQGITVNESPVGCAFVGELGFTGVVPITSCLDFRFGYFGLWLSGLVQPTQQLNGQVLTQPAGGVDPTAGSINANGATLVQGVSLGLEGRW